MTITEVKTSDTRWDRLQWRFQRVVNWLLEVRRVGLFLLLMSFFSGFFGFRTLYLQDPASFNWQTFVGDFYANVSSELGSVAITVLIIDYLNERRQRTEQKKQLIRQMGSAERGLALNAVDELRALGAVKDGSLVGIYLEEAKLSGVRLGRADLRYAHMDFADLSNSHMYFANLEGADMSGSDFRGAVLTGANLRRADFVAAKLQGALLSEADLTHAKLDKAQFDETTQLPDKSNWAPRTDLSRFTDPTHPKYWRSEMPESPAYAGRRAAAGD